LNGEKEVQHEGGIQVAVSGGAVIISGADQTGVEGALLIPGEGSTLLVNGSPVADSCRVFPGDAAEIFPVEYVEPFRVEVRVSADAMSASARFIPARRISHEIIDQPFAAKMIIKAVRNETEAPGGTPDDLKKALDEAEVCFGLQEDQLPQLLAEPGCWRSVADGEPPVEGRHGLVEPLFSGELKRVSYAQNQERVDFRERYEIEQVEPGEVIAVIHPPVAGKPGHTVCGRIIEPKPVLPASVNCGNGAAIISAGRVVATRKGVPGFKAGRVYRLQVDDVYIHRGDIDIRSGNANFQGHLEITGDIAEGMKVLAEGNVIVGGAAAGALVLAGGSIVFRKQCIKCQVRAGWRETLLQELYDLVGQLFGALGYALSAAEELIRVLQQRGKYSEKAESALLRALLHGKFNEIPRLATELSARSRESSSVLPAELLKTITEAAPYFIDYSYSQLLDRPILLKIYAALQACLEEKPISNSGAGITAPYVQNSNLTCSGDIIITGSGVYNSQFKCGGSVIIKKAFRGGTIEAGGEVRIGEAGSPRMTGDQGLVMVPKDSAVCIGRAYESFRVIFGQWEYCCLETISNVRLRFDPYEYSVKLEPWKNA